MNVADRLLIVDLVLDHVVAGLGNSSGGSADARVGGRGGSGGSGDGVSDSRGVGDVIGDIVVAASVRQAGNNCCGDGGGDY